MPTNTVALHIYAQSKEVTVYTIQRINLLSHYMVEATVSLTTRKFDRGRSRLYLHLTEQLPYIGLLNAA